MLIKAARVRNQQGKLVAGGSLAELLLGAGRLDNQQGSLTASAITLVAGDTDNSTGTLTSLAGNQQLTVQRLLNRSGLIEASDTVQLRPEPGQQRRQADRPCRRQGQHRIERCAGQPRWPYRQRHHRVQGQGREPAQPGRQRGARRARQPGA
ncbi:hypothetical protein [Pseudomonas sp. CCOS 191]|uniref:hypothetical protein n=1 Tax=Pseudomonas sp. CCOS 191 TaxID=1649877 RepID=UPI001E5A0924|nr:hypothetical protein [Pseudomonas sp. CCOS 191]